MSEIPCIIFNENAESNSESNTTIVENKLKEIYDLRSKKLTYNTRLEFEDKLRSLLDYVTLIGYEILPKFYKSKRQHDFTKDDEILVYYYNEEMIRILGLQLMVENELKAYTKGCPMFDSVDNLEIYKIDSIKNKRCLVYDIDTTYGERSFNLNYELSNLENIILDDIKINLTY